MATVRVTHSIGDLASDMVRVATTTTPKLSKVVAKNIKQGNRAAQGFARKSSGPHGANYFKRITSEMTGALTGEYGPTGDVVGNAVGAGWRGGPQNTDLPRSADVQAPKFAKDVDDVVDGLFW